jgi:hypothetical protein
VADPQRYVIQGFGFSGSVRNTCWQVVLQLQEDGRFRLLRQEFYHDWGTRREVTWTFTGTYHRLGDVLQLHATGKRVFSREADRDWGTDDTERQDFTFDRVWECRPTTESEAPCPLDFHGFLEQPMRADLAPHSGVF